MNDTAWVNNGRDTVEIEFIDASNNKVSVSAEAGRSLMQVATAAMIEGIDGDCGGACACGTCRIEIESCLEAEIHGPDEIEQHLLESLAVEDISVRLGCQVIVTDAFQGKVFKVAT